MHKNIDQLRYQTDFKSTEPPSNENETVNIDILVDKDILLQQPVVSLNHIAPKSHCDQWTPGIKLTIHNRPQAGADLRGEPYSLVPH